MSRDQANKSANRPGKRTVVTLAAGIVCAGLSLAATPVRAETNLAAEFAASWDACAAATYSVERETRIPSSLLTAISIVESGRYDAINKRSVAWPWTVTSGKDQWYLDSRAEAISHVKSMIRNGKRNIDVGCMQVNLYFHGDAFSSLDQAFDPLSNVSYAASFLNRLMSSTGDWLTAAGNYHSSTPEYHNRYKAKVVDTWRAERQNYAANAQLAYNRAGLLFVNPDVPPIDQARTAELNAAFQRRLAAEEVDEQVQSGAISGTNWQMAYLNQGQQAEQPQYALGDNYTLLAQVNRVRKATNRKKLLDELAQQHENISADKRASDLDKWRNMYSQAVNGPSMLQLLSGGMQ